MKPKYRYKVEFFAESTDWDVRKVKTEVNIYMNASIVGEMGNIFRVCKIKVQEV